MYASLGCGALWVPNVLLGPISLGIFVSLAVALDPTENPFAKTPFSWFSRRGGVAVPILFLWAWVFFPISGAKWRSCRWRSWRMGSEYRHCPGPLPQEQICPPPPPSERYTGVEAPKPTQNPKIPKIGGFQRGVFARGANLDNWGGCAHRLQ